MSKGTSLTLPPDNYLPQASRRSYGNMPLSVAYSGLKGIAVLFSRLLPFHILAFLLGRVSIMGELIPFGLACFIAVAGTHRRHAPLVGLLTLGGAFSVGHYMEAAIYVCCMISYYVLTGRATLAQRRLKIVPLVLAFTIILVAFALLFWQQIVLYHMILVFFNISACLVLSHVFARGLPLIDPRSKRPATEEQLVCLVVILAAAIAGLGNMEIQGHSVRNIAGGFLVMALLREGGVGLGVAVGTTVGVAVGLNDNNGALAVAYYAIAALVGGMFHSLGKLAIGFGYILGLIMAVSYFVPSHNLLNALTEATAAAVLFLAVPAGWWGDWREKLRPIGWGRSSWPALIAATQKLGQVSAMFSDIAAHFRHIKNSVAGQEEDIHQIVDQVSGRVCRQCSRQSLCWEMDFYRTYQALVDMLFMPRQQKPDRRSMPQILRNQCLMQEELLAAVAQASEAKQAQLYWQRKVLEQREMLAEQMIAASEIARQLAEEIRRVPKCDRETAAFITEQTTSAGCALEDVRVSGWQGSMKIEGLKEPCHGNQECMNILAPLVADIAGMRLTVENECGSRPLRRKCKVTLKAACRFQVEAGIASTAKDRQISGDSCSVFQAGQGKIAAIISDGMGSGGKAANESRAVVRFLEKLLLAGFHVDAAVKTVNAMLLLRLPGENYATVDMAIFDLYTGEVEFLKTGSSVSFVKRVREVATVEKASLPVGILENVEIEPVRRKLASGDLVIMISDGVAEADRQRSGRDWVSNFLRLTPDAQPQKLADLLLERAAKLSGQTIADDMTVLVIKVTEQQGVV